MRTPSTRKKATSSTQPTRSKAFCSTGPMPSGTIMKPASSSTSTPADTITPCPAILCADSSTPQQKCSARWDSKTRSEEHTSELQSHSDIVCRLLLEKKTHLTTH